MQKLLSKNTPRLYAAAFLFLAFGSILYGAKAGQSSPEKVQFLNKTKSLQVSPAVSEAGGQRFVVLKLTNKSDKSIAAYGFVVGPGQTMVCDGSTTAVGIAPYGEETKQFPLPEKGFVPELSALVFEDGTAEGDPKAVAYLKDARKGAREQFEQALQVLKTDQADKTTSLPARLQNLRGKFSSLPEQRTNSIESRGIDSGLSSAKQFLVYQIQELEEEMQKGNQSDASASLGRLIAHLETALKKLEKEAK